MTGAATIATFGVAAILLLAWSWRHDLASQRYAAAVLAAEFVLSVVCLQVPFSEPTAIAHRYAHPRIYAQAGVDLAAMVLLTALHNRYRCRWLLVMVFLLFADCTVHFFVSLRPYISGDQKDAYDTWQNVILALAMAACAGGPHFRDFVSIWDPPPRVCPRDQMLPPRASERRRSH